MAIGTPDRLEPPPRLLGEPQQDLVSLREWAWALYQNLILNKGVVQAIDQPTGSFDVTTGALVALPIGAVFISIVETDPAELLGYGTWEAFGTGRVLVGIDPDDTDFDTAEEEGGSKEVTPAGSVSAPTFTGDALGTHQHGPGARAVDDHSPTTAGVTAGSDFQAVTAIDSHAVSGDDEAVSAGTPSGTNSAPAFTGTPQSTLQPYQTVYMWKRVS